MPKKSKNLSQVPNDNKSSNAEAFTGALNTENTTYNKKKIQITTAQNNDKKPRLSKNATENDAQQELKSSVDETVKGKKRTYYKKSPTKTTTINKKPI